MNHARFQLPDVHYPLPRPPEPAMNPRSFVACPLALMERLPLQQLYWHFFLYQMAFTAAAASNRPSLPERDLLAVWN
jgi:hypothetical protein